MANCFLTVLISLLSEQNKLFWYIKHHCLPANLLKTCIMFFKREKFSNEYIEIGPSNALGKN